MLPLTFIITYYVFQCLCEKQKNQLATWTIEAVLANDLFTDGSFVLSTALLLNFIIRFLNHDFCKFSSNVMEKEVYHVLK